MSAFPLFDYERAGVPGAGVGEQMLSVSELTMMVKEALELDFSDVGLRGEVSNLARPRSGHLYFSLKDPGAQVRAVMWKSTASRVVFDLTDGLAVKVWGDLTVYAPRGEYQLVVRAIEPEGIGALDLAFRQTCERLRAEGLFDEERKRLLPMFPRRIVVVTSPTGAAVRDFLQVVGRRWPGTEILIAPVRVQGPGAAEEIAEGIALANRVEGADIVVVARGGGSLEDLWAFNEEVVARAIFSSRLPVVSAVGHEVDVTVADLVADVRALTPTDAGTRCVPDGEALRNLLDSLSERLAAASRNELMRYRNRLEILDHRLTRAGQARVDETRALLTDLSRRAEAAMTRGLDRRAHDLARLAAQLDALSPLAVLARGYSLTLKDDRATVLRRAADCLPGDRIVTRLASGRVVSRVESVEAE